MAFLITLKPNHPSGSMRRDGIVISYVHPVILDEVPEGMKKDDYFEKKVINKKDVPDLVAKGAIDMRANKESIESSDVANVDTNHVEMIPVETIHESSLRNEKSKSKKAK